MNRSRILSVLVGVVLTFGCSDTEVDREAEARELMQLSRHWSSMVESGDLEASIELWADDAVMLPPELPALYGKAAIREYVLGAAEIPGFKISWEPEVARVSASGDMAYMIEHNVIEVDDESGEKVVTHGKVVTIWRKDADEQWKNVVDMWNAAPPPNQ